MKNACAAIAALALLASPLLADQKLDEAVAKAEEQFQKGKADDALKTLQKAVSQNADNPEAHVALGRLLERMGQFDEAAASLQKATQVGAAAAAATRARALAALASFELHRGTGREALAHATQAAALDQAPATLSVLARAQARAGDPTKALETAERAVQSGPSAAAEAARGAALLALQRGDDAAAAFRKALELDPKLNEARVELAVALLAGGKAKEAVAEARKASEADPRSGEAFAVLGKAILTENPKSWNDAIAQAQQGAFLDPKNPEVQTIVGGIFEAGGNLDQASASYKRAADVDPGYVPAQLALIYVQVRRGDVDGALAAAQKLAAETPQSGAAQLQLGRVLLRKNDFAGAVDALEKATTYTPGSAEAWALLGTAYQFTRRTSEAATAYKHAVELAPANVDYMTTYGLLLGMTGEGDAGAKLLRQVIASPGYNSPDGYLNLGWVYRNMKPPRTEESVAAYKKALALDPKNEQAALGMGWAYSYSRMWDESIAAFKKAIELEPKIAGEAYNGIAWCYFFKRDMPQAKTFLGKAQAAGRTDTRLGDDIAKIEKLIVERKSYEEEIAKTQGPTQEQGPDLPTVANQLMKGKDARTRLAAAREICAFGREAVQFLTYTLQTDPDVDVRFAAVNCLASLGGRAKEAVPVLQQLVNAERTIDPNAPPSVMRAELREEDLRRLMKDVIQKIQGGR